MVHPTIKFTFEVSFAKVSFLDTLTYFKDNHIETTLYCKPTDKHTYLLPTSCHPPHTFKGIPFSQALRIRRICSEPTEEEIHLNHLKTHLLKRNYDEEIIDKQITKAKTHERKGLLTYKQKQKKSQRVPLVITYNPAFNNIRPIINRHLHILQNDERLKQIFTTPPIIAFRRPRNTRDLLVSAKVPSIEENAEPGCTRCDARRCSVCPYINISKKFTSTATGDSFPITSKITCKSTWIIYLITCTKCKLQYVGKTTNSLYTRFTGTKSDIKLNKKSLPIVHHFNSNDHSFEDISISGIETIRKQRDDIILKRESFWIAKLLTLRPHGINADI